MQCYPVYIYTSSRSVVSAGVLGLSMNILLPPRTSSVLPVPVLPLPPGSPLTLLVCSLCAPRSAHDSLPSSPSVSPPSSLLPPHPCPRAPLLVLPNSNDPRLTSSNGRVSLKQLSHTSSTACSAISSLLHAGWLLTLRIARRLTHAWCCLLNL